MKNPFLGGVLLIAGTTLGVGMLAFPTVSAFGGFFPSVFLFVAIWLLMLLSSFFFLDANLSIKEDSNMITMAERTLGTWGKVVAWVVYLLLLYSLIAAYIAGCAPLFVEAIHAITGYTLPGWLSFFILPLVFGSFIYFGTSGVDFINRFLMLGLVISYCLLVFFIPGQVDVDKLLHFDFEASFFAVPVAITAFGYHIIIPSLSRYFSRDKSKLRAAIFVGSLVPIIVYLLWQLLVLGVVPISDLANAYVQGESATTPLAAVLQNSWIKLAAKFFAFFAIVTSFVGVTLSLSDFLADGFKIKKTWEGRLLAIFLTFLPPLFFVFTYKKGFYIALDYAGAFVAILLVCLPALMVWKLKSYRNAFRRFVLCLVILLGASVVVFDVLEESGHLKALISHYTS